MGSPEADRYVEALGLERHPEGGAFRRTWTHPDLDADGRALASSIHYLLDRDERSHWHRIDATESWLWHAGGPMRLAIWVEGTASVEEHVLGPDLSSGQHLQVTVPAHAWQSAEAVDGFALVSCVVVPEFSFDAFELAPDGWSPAV